MSRLPLIFATVLLLHLGAAAFGYEATMIAIVAVIFANSSDHE